MFFYAGHFRWNEICNLNVNGFATPTTSTKCMSINIVEQIQFSIKYQRAFMLIIVLAFLFDLVIQFVFLRSDLDSLKLLRFESIFLEN